MAQLFFQSLGLVSLLWPLVIIAAILAHSANLLVLGGAILMGIIWIPYGWAADDPVGLQHAIARSILSYVCFLFAPEPYKASQRGSSALLHVQPDQNAKSIRAISNHANLVAVMSMCLAAGHAFKKLTKCRATKE